ncbi:hypothetical protein [Amycolatopsis sp. NPDC059657]
MKKPYVAPKLTARGTFATSTAGFGKFLKDGKVIPVGRIVP